MEDSVVPSNLSVPKVPEPDRAATSARAKNKNGPKPGEHVQLFRMKRDCNKGFYPEKCYLEASAGQLVFRGIGGCQTAYTQTLPPTTTLSGFGVGPGTVTPIPGTKWTLCGSAPNAISSVRPLG